MAAPLVLIPGRHSEQAVNHRTPVVSAGRMYADAIERAGGIPVVLPPTDNRSLISDAIGIADAVVLLGGGDVCPQTYGQQEKATLYGVNEALDLFEKIIIEHVIKKDIPMLAICRGHQMLNVALGGTLIQHLDTTQDHRDVMHSVHVVSDSSLARALQTTTPRVHSFHHQAIDQLAEKLRIVATHDDGTIEAVEHIEASWIIGVQWHPEDTASDDVHQQNLFAELIRRAK